VDAVSSEMEVDVGQEQVQELTELVGEFITGQILQIRNHEALIAELLSRVQLK